VFPPEFSLQKGGDKKKQTHTYTFTYLTHYKIIIIIIREKIDTHKQAPPNIFKEI